jgi:hypothetical protein
LRRDGTHPDTRWYKRGDSPQYEYYLFWKDAQTGRRIPGHGDTQLRSAVIVVRTREGWRIRSGYCVWTTIVSRWSRERHEPEYEEMVRRGGLRGFINTGGHLQVLGNGPMRAVTRQR